MTSTARDASRSDASDLCVLVYLSAECRPFGRDELLDLLRKARAHNAAARITGLLLYHQGGFMQALEGPRDAVLALVERIRADRRHHRLITVLDAPRTERYFPDWAMGFVDATSEPLPDGFSRLLTDAGARRVLRHHPDRVHQLLRAYAEHELERSGTPAR